MSETEEPTLRLGDESVDGWVEYTQRLLLFHGENCGAVDGRFGPKTLAAVHAYQGSHHLMVDGVVGNQTWASLRGGTPEDPSTDGRVPGTFQETGPESRWFVEGDGLVFNVANDEVLLAAVNTGDVAIDAGSFTSLAAVTTSRGDELLWPVTIPPGTSAAPGEMFTWLMSDLFLVHGPGSYAVVATMPAELGGDSKSFTLTFEGDDPSDLLNVTSHLVCPHGGTVRVIATTSATLGTGSPVLLATDPAIVECVVGFDDILLRCQTVVWVTTGGHTSVAGRPVLTRRSSGMCMNGVGGPTGSVVILA